MSQQRSTPFARFPLAAFLLHALVACGGADERSALQVERDTVGDTVIVRTVAGQDWEADRTLEPDMRIGTFEGEDVYMLGDINGLAVAPDGAIYLYDRQIPALRKYSPDGEYVATFGREGSGPGEYKQSDGGMAVLSDGRVLLRDPGNGRINVYSPDGESLDHWDLRGGYFTSRPLYVDTADHSYTQIWGANAAGERYGGLQRLSPQGEPGDSLLAPEWDHELATLTFSREGMSMTNVVPFTAREMWAFHPHGYFVGGVSTEYSIDLFRTDGPVLRIQRVVEPVPVDPDEAANAREQASANFRRNAPDWRWNGPAVPATKAPFTAIQVGRDGRLWVQIARPGVPVPEDEIEASDDPRTNPPDRWVEPIVYDVFESDGTYLGQVRTPEGFSRYPIPVFDRDHVWAITTDDLDVEYLVRYRIRPAGTEAVGSE